MPSTRSSSTAWPIDSWTWSSIWPESRTSVVTSLGQSVAESSSTASVAVRSASSSSPSLAMCSQPAAAMWPRNEFGYERRWSSPSATAVASRPAPECRTVCSISLPSDDAKDVRTRNRSMPASANARPSTSCIRRVASINRATFSSSDTLKGSSWNGLAHVPEAGSTPVSVTGSRGRRAAARAISTARPAVRAISAPSGRAVAAKPQYPSTSTRTPTPSEVARSIPSISWLRTVMDSDSSRTNRASA